MLRNAHLIPSIATTCTCALWRGQAYTHVILCRGFGVTWRWLPYALNSCALP